jgi:hypothetical protein
MFTSRFAARGERPTFKRSIAWSDHRRRDFAFPAGRQRLGPPAGNENDELSKRVTLA